LNIGGRLLLGFLLFFRFLICLKGWLSSLVSDGDWREKQGFSADGWAGYKPEGGMEDIVVEDMGASAGVREVRYQKVLLPFAGVRIPEFAKRVNSDADPQRRWTWTPGWQPPSPHSRFPPLGTPAFYYWI
jgi:hypothetical protein